jgi:hypothetical protein
VSNQHCVKAQGFPFVGEDLARATPEALAQEYLDMLRSVGIFSGAADRRRRAVGSELLRRGFAFIGDEGRPFAVRVKGQPPAWWGAADDATVVAFHAGAYRLASCRTCSWWASDNGETGACSIPETEATVNCGLTRGAELCEQYDARDLRDLR